MKIQGLKTNDYSDLQQTNANEPNPATELKNSVSQALAEVQQFREANGEYLSEENLVELNRIETMLTAQSAAIDAYGVGGAAGAYASSDEYAFYDMPTGLDPEWNGINSDSIYKDANDMGRFSDDPEWYGEYQGSFTIPNSGDKTNPNKFSFQMTDDMIGVFAESRGRDMIVTVVYGDAEQSRKTWVVKDGSIRSEPFIISAAGVSHGVTIDCSRLLRQHDNVWIHGSEYDDLIKGSQGNDTIIAWKGNDEIFGNAGNDIIYADEYYDRAGQHDPSYGDNDRVHGGLGNDQINMGGGSQDVVFTSDRGEMIAEEEIWENDIAMIPDGIDAVIGGDGNWEVSKIEDGMVTVSNNNPNGVAGEIILDMAELPGYNMAFGEMGSDGSLIVTFAGEAGAFKVKFKDFFKAFLPNTGNPNDAIVSLTINGTDGSEIFNFDKVIINETNSQIINLHGGAGDDLMFGAHNDMLKNGLSTDTEDMLKSSESPAILGSYVNSGVFTSSEQYSYADADKKKWNGYEAGVNPQGQIEIKADAAYAGGRPEVLHLKVPAGYSKGYITQHADGNTYVICVKPTASGRAESIVFKIDGSLGLAYNEILVQSSGTTTVGEGGASTTANSNAIPLIAVSLDDTDYLTSGGEGDDLVFMEEGAKKDSADKESEIVRQQVATAYTNYTPPASSGGGSDGRAAAGAAEGSDDGSGEGA